MITEQQAIETAQAYAESKNWPWLAPVECKRHSRWFGNAVYVVRTNCGNRGANAVITIDEMTGAINDTRFLRR